MNETNKMDERASQYDSRFIESRITKVESRVDYMSIEQSNLKATNERLTSVLEKIGNQIATSDTAVAVQREQLTQHSREIERQNANMVDISKIVDKHEKDITTMMSSTGVFQSSIKWFVTIAGSAIIGFVVNHFLLLK